jgi:hypothetical protein
MPAMQSGTFACPGTDRQRRLAHQLAELIPGSATVLVNLRDPQMAWPCPHASAQDAAAREVQVNRTTAKVAARWILRTYPEADWTEAHLFNFATATLTSAAQAATSRER